MDHTTPNFFKTHVTPELRATVREQMRHIKYIPTSPEYAEQAILLTKLAQILIDGMSDAELDHGIIQHHYFYDSRRIL